MSKEKAERNRLLVGYRRLGFSWGVIATDFNTTRSRARMLYLFHKDKYPLTRELFVDVVEYMRKIIKEA